MNGKTIASSPTREGLIKLTNEYFMTTTCAIDFETGVVSNSKGQIGSVRAVKEKGRYKLKQI